MTTVATIAHKSPDKPALIYGNGERVESFGLKIGAIQNTPSGFINEARLGLPGRDRQIENYQATVRAVGRAGIPVLSHNFRPDPLYRTGTKIG